MKDFIIIDEMTDFTPKTIRAWFEPQIFAQWKRHVRRSTLRSTWALKVDRGQMLISTRDVHSDSADWRVPKLVMKTPPMQGLSGPLEPLPQFAGPGDLR